MKTSERLLARLREAGAVPRDLDVDMRRLNPSGSMRNEGAWSWSASWGEHRTEETAGSQWPMADCLAAPVLHVSRNDFGEISIDPYTEDGKLYFGKRKGRS